MKKIWKISAGAAIVASVLLSPAIAKDPGKDDAAARVYYVDGPKMDYKKAGKGDWVAGKKDMAGFVTDHFRTDKSTAAGLELLIGGRVGLKEGSEIVLVSDGEAASVKGGKINKIVLNSGGAWAKFQKQDRPLTIQTRGGVMGIKGTEFVVETQESGETEITLLEGSVDYKDNSGQDAVLVPGQKLSQFEKDDELYVVKGEPKEVDKSVEEFESGQRPVSEVDSVQQALDENWRKIPQAIIDGSINGLRDNALQGLGIPSGLIGTINQWVPGIPNWGGWVPDLSINGYIPSIPGIRLPRW